MSGALQAMTGPRLIFSGSITCGTNVSIYGYSSSAGVGSKSAAFDPYGLTNLNSDQSSTLQVTFTSSIGEQSYVHVLCVPNGYALVPWSSGFNFVLSSSPLGFGSSGTQVVQMWA